MLVYFFNLFFFLVSINSIVQTVGGHFVFCHFFVIFHKIFFL